ncbi:molybdenum cofactor guanylyltransferase [Gordonia neofelifaecis]|uniref:Molybdopterin-guanine dinucleotide biosynthesis protein n=1 Tax=Gordonia neofelifaecis NRRL B-59395 TaxID=644548 RepID=F1YJ99_9ACTN|nr:NTP transferase domain-containing protein [Gordonia neofelifaecis]EGD55132.1 molybdopterin-guanine dinucleotide biosynthesis protein [Gordonia neofelifaecis NRRL B-59395]
MTAAIVLAGGRATRMGGVDKAAVDIAGRSLIDIVYEAVADAHPVIVVGPESLERPGVRVIREDPPFGGPVAGLAAALAAIDTDEVWLLACDLPRASAIVAQLREVPLAAADDAVILEDADGRAQWLAGRYRAGALRRALARLPEVRDASMRALVGGLALRSVVDRAGATIDLDTWDDVENYRAVTARPSSLEDES